MNHMKGTRQALKSVKSRKMKGVGKWRAQRNSRAEQSTKNKTRERKTTQERTRQGQSKEAQRDKAYERMSKDVKGCQRMSKCQVLLSLVGGLNPSEKYSQLGWLDTQYMGIWNWCSKPPSSSASLPFTIFCHFFSRFLLRALPRKILSSILSVTTAFWGTICQFLPLFTGKTMVSCRFSLKIYEIYVQNPSI